MAMQQLGEVQTIECDASGVVGLRVQSNLLPFFSKALIKKTLFLSAYEKDLLILVTKVNKWRPYLLEQTFKVKIDQHALKYFLEQKMFIEAQQKCTSKLIGVKDRK